MVVRAAANPLRHLFAKRIDDHSAVRSAKIVRGVVFHQRGEERVEWLSVAAPLDPTIVGSRPDLRKNGNAIRVFES